MTLRILLIDQENLGLDFALRSAAAGHQVRWFLYADKGKKSRTGEGFKGLEIVDDWRPHMMWAKEGLILCTGNFRFLHELDRYRDHGFKIFSPTVASAKLEIDRSHGMKAMEAAGIELPPYHVFDTLQDAEKFARKSDQCFVFKPMGDEEDKSLTFAASSPEEMSDWINDKIRRGKKLKGKCMLQEKIDMLCDYGVSGWFGPEGFLTEKWQICFEHKKLGEGETGPNTGEMGTVCQYVEKEKLATDILKPLEAAISVTGHRGDFSIGVGVDTKGKAWPFEFTARCGWPAFYIQTASHKGDPAQWMRDLLDGKDSLKVSRDVAIGVVLAQPRWPYNCSPPEVVEGNPIAGVEDVYDDLHFAGVMIGKGANGKPQYQTTAEYVAIATGLGKTITQARKRVYDVVGQVKIPDKIYRRDIGEKLEPVLPKLHSAGYAKDLAYS